MQVSTIPLHPFCISRISTSRSHYKMTTILIVNYNKIYEKISKLLWVRINEDSDNRGSDTYLSFFFTGAHGLKLHSGHLDWLMDKLDGVATNWKNFGLYLNPHLYKRLNEIEADYRKCFDCLRETVVCWLTRTTDPNSVDLMNALNKIDEKKLAHDIQQEISQGNNNYTITYIMLSIQDCKCLSWYMFLIFTLQHVGSVRALIVPRPNFPITLT